MGTGLHQHVNIWAWDYSSSCYVTTPSSHPTPPPQASRDIQEMEEEMNALYESAGLFEVNMPDYKQLKTCRREVVMLKTLWDVVTLVSYGLGSRYGALEGY